jgi:hypothetical protein
MIDPGSGKAEAEKRPLEIEATCVDATSPDA